GRYALWTGTLAEDDTPPRGEELARREEWFSLVRQTPGGPFNRTKSNGDRIFCRNAPGSGHDRIPRPRPGDAGIRRAARSAGATSDHRRRPSGRTGVVDPAWNTPAVRGRRAHREIRRIPHRPLRHPRRPGGAFQRY